MVSNSKLGKRARRTKKHSKNKKTRYYENNVTTKKNYKSKDSESLVMYCYLFYYVGHKGTKQLLSREGSNSKDLKRWLKYTVSNFSSNSIIGCVIRKTYRDGKTTYSYRGTLENWDKYMVGFMRNYPDAKFIGYINKDV